MTKGWRVSAWGLSACAVALGLLCLPPRAVDPAPAPARGAAFTWDRDAFWRALEHRFVLTRGHGCAGIAPATTLAIAGIESRIDDMSKQDLAPDAPAFDSLDRAVFELTPVIAACPDHVREYLEIHPRLREMVKAQSRRWDAGAITTRRRLYESLYGARAAAEEIIVQRPDSALALFVAADAPSATPSALVRGVTIHSGDILVSRGGYPTSALIARGNDFPGNFSHVALVYVDSITHEALTIEAHIERGVAISTADQYLADKKLRVMVMRPRADLPQLERDPQLPHRAATAMLERARRSHIPYDFAMDYRDPSALFCSEVASAAYAGEGIHLWTGPSTITAPGLRRWLASFGVTHFETQEPSDIEYDPQLIVAAEWRDPAQLERDRIDNAVIDVMLEGAERGDAITYSWYKLPLYRIAKAYSVVLNAFGRIGPIPEGMSAVAALRNSAFSARQRAIAARTGELAAARARRDGYSPPYWTLVELARSAASAAPAR